MTVDERYTKTPSCEERIDKELERELERIRQAQVWQRISDEGIDLDDDTYSHEDELEEIEEETGVTPDDSWGRETVDDYLESLLEVTPLYTVYRVGLSWGGPADGFLVYVDPEDKTIAKIEYYFQDWFDGATRTLSNSAQETVEETLRIALGLDT